MAVPWTATHRFVFLAMHVAHQGDDEIQDEEYVALVDAAMRIGLAEDIPEEEMTRMVAEAADAYMDTVMDGDVGERVQECSDALRATFPEGVRLELLMALRDVAKAHGGVNRDEHLWLHELQRDWRIDRLAPE